MCSLVGEIRRYRNGRYHYNYSNAGCLNPGTVGKHKPGRAFTQPAKETALPRVTKMATPQHTVNVCCMENERKLLQTPTNRSHGFDYVFGAKRDSNGFYATVLGFN